VSKSNDQNDLTLLRELNPTDQDKLHTKQLEELAAQKAVDEHDRDRITKNIISWCMRGLIILVFLVIGLAIIALGWHTLLPEKWHWLTTKQFTDVKNFMLSGTCQYWYHVLATIYRFASEIRVIILLILGINRLNSC